MKSSKSCIRNIRLTKMSYLRNLLIKSEWFMMPFGKSPKIVVNCKIEFVVIENKVFLSWFSTL